MWFLFTSGVIGDIMTLSTDAEDEMKTFTDRNLKNMFDHTTRMAEHGLLTNRDGSQLRGTPVASAFWDGYNGLKRSANAIKGTMSEACFEAGKAWKMSHG